jgi:hypothetical protein
VWCSAVQHEQPRAVSTAASCTAANTAFSGTHLGSGPPPPAPGRPAWPRSTQTCATAPAAGCGRTPPATGRPGHGTPVCGCVYVCRVFFGGEPGGMRLLCVRASMQHTLCVPRATHLHAAVVDVVRLRVLRQVRRLFQQQVLHACGVSVVSQGAWDGPIEQPMSTMRERHPRTACTRAFAATHHTLTADCSAPGPWVRHRL